MIHSEVSVALLPWKKFELAIALPAQDVIRLLQRSVPACRRRPVWDPDRAFFCGEMDAASGWFRLRANVAAKARGVSPTLVGRVRPAAHGSVIEAAITPSVTFWFGVLIPCFLLAFVPIGVLAWLFGDSTETSELVAFIVFPVVGMMVTSWLWGTLLVIHYVHSSRYQTELGRLLERVAERTPQGQYVVDLPETPEQAEAKRRSRTRAVQNGLKVVAACIAALGGLMFCVGVKGVVTKELTTYSRSRTHMHGPRVKSAVTLSGEKAVTASQGLLALGAALVLTGGVCFLVSRRDPNLRAWPPLETALLAVVALLSILGLVCMVRGYS